MRTNRKKGSRLTIKGQITLPKAYRDALGWGPRTVLTFVKERDGIKIIAIRERADPGTALVNKLRGVGNHRFTTEQVMALTRGEG
jgi:AbrB family looped-hinge helix DNA binding protein